MCRCDKLKSCIKQEQSPDHDNDYDSGDDRYDDDLASKASSGGAAAMGGGMRALLFLLAKKISLKSILRKRAFLLIGGTTEGGAVDNNKVVTTRRSSAVAFSHTRTVVYVEATLMGMVVFGTYDVLINCYNDLKSNNHSSDTKKNESAVITTKNNDIIVNLHDKSHDVAVHALAGAAAGIARTAFWMGWEAVVHRNFWALDHSKFCIRNTMHHAAGFGTLFGTFQLVRQTLLFLDPLVVLTTHNNAKSDSHSYDAESTSWTKTIDYVDVYEMTSTTRPLMYTAMAGGMAGQTHHIVQHYTSHWKQFASRGPPPPRLYPTLTSFGTMSLCFLAFEHGPQIVDGWMEEMIERIDNIMSKYYS